MSGTVPAQLIRKRNAGIIMSIILRFISFKSFLLIIYVGNYLPALDPQTIITFNL